MVSARAALLYGEWGNKSKRLVKLGAPNKRESPGGPFRGAGRESKRKTRKTHTDLIWTHHRKKYKRSKKVRGGPPSIKVGALEPLCTKI